jgi:hypothetical protein
MNIIDRLKKNTSAFGLMDPEMREAAEEIGCGKFLWWDEHWHADGNKRFMDEYTYRLRADYVCPHPEAKKHEVTGGSVCCWCNEETKPKMGWKIYPVTRFDGKPKPFFAVQFGKDKYTENVTALAALEGFGGIQYRINCGCGQFSKEIFLMTPIAPCEKCGPYEPIAVQFWEVLE